MKEDSIYFYAGFYPSITLCDEDPFRFHPCSESGNCVNPLTIEELEIRGKYKSYILGQEQNFNDTIVEALEKIDYDNKTIALSDLVDEITINIHSERNKNIRATYNVIGNSLEANKDKGFFKKYSAFSNFSSLEKIDAYVSARNGRYKCFTVDTPILVGKRIGKIIIRLKSNKDTDSFDPSFNLNQVYMTLTYPNQTLQESDEHRILLNEFFVSKIKEMPRCYEFEVLLSGMEVVHRRDKSNDRCNVDS